MDLKLKRYNSYSREDLHRITMPQESKFTRGSGKWGLHGIITIPLSKQDFVFFVTFGHKEGEHQFKEGITHEGKLAWQSQPNQKLHYPQIKRFIYHNESKNNIHLLLRTSTDKEYTYFGKLKYLSHNPDREQPVWFQWQIIDWKINKQTFKNIGLTLSDEDELEEVFESVPKFTGKNDLILGKKPKPRKKRKSKKPSRTNFKTNYEHNAQISKEIGTIGEKIVMDFETKKLEALGIQKFPEQVSILDDGKGYDIISYDEKGIKMFIEVKTTSSGVSTPFYISPNEINVSKEKTEQYFIYRLYNLDKELPAAEYYKIQGDVSEQFDLEPSEYKAYFKGME